MDVVTATAVQEKSMTIFTIDSENNIAAHGSASEINDQGCEQFTSEKELAQLTADWPGSRLVDIWNRIPGLTPVKRFTNRAVATARIWRAVESLVSGEHRGDVAPARRQAARKPTGALTHACRRPRSSFGPPLSRSSHRVCGPGCRRPLSVPCDRL